jgi:hypothetical protein
MSFYNTQDLPNFSVYPSRDQRAPYGTIQNIPIIQAIDRFAFETIPVTLVKDGTFIVLQGDYPVSLPGNLTLFKFLGGFKYISNGDIQSIEVIHRGNDYIEIYNPDNESYDGIYPGECHCLVIRWTTEDEGGNRLPIDQVYYTILSSNNLMLAQKLNIDVEAKKASFKAKRSLKRK